MITSQNVLIPFNQFPSHFLSILDRITESKTNMMSSLGGFFTFSSTPFFDLDFPFA